ncbi:Chitotriosidase-1 [Nymphon striatum]|nr:Chitotriosidase-1 [Nymphon striatum]
MNQETLGKGYNNTLRLFIFINSDLIIFLLGYGDAEEKSYRRVCYYRPNGIQPKDIPVDLCTHINFAFLTIKNNELISQRQKDVKIFKELTTLKEAKPSLKLLFSVGGWSQRHVFPAIAVNSQTREEFINTSISFIEKHNFDGLDIDWEYPIGPDKDRFLLLLKSSRPLTAYNSPLYAEVVEVGPDRKRNAVIASINFSIHEWITSGAPLTQLNMGIPTYGRGYVLANENNHGFNAAAVGAAGTFKYHQSNYIKAMNLGGSVTWTIDNDDWPGICGFGKLPIHTAIWKILK